MSTARNLYTHLDRPVSNFLEELSDLGAVQIENYSVPDILSERRNLSAPNTLLCANDFSVH